MAFKKAKRISAADPCKNSIGNQRIDRIERKETFYSGP